MPPKRGVKKRSMAAWENPLSRSARAVGTSLPRRSRRGSLRRNRARMRATRALSTGDPMGANVVEASVPGRLNGSPITVPFPFRHINAPGSNVFRSSAAMSRCRWISGYPVSNTWNPRSRTKPSTMSLRTRPPTPSDDSKITASTPDSESTRAAVRPANPAPTITTSADAGTGRVVISSAVLAARSRGRGERNGIHRRRAHPAPLADP